MTQRLVRTEPLLSIVPRPLVTDALAAHTSAPLSYFSVEFRAPWTGDVQVKQYKSTVRIQFPEGQFIMFSDPSQGIDRIKSLRENRQGDPERVFGSQAMRSNFAFVQTTLRLTPKDITLWRPRVQLVRNCVMFGLKLAEIGGTETGLFQFQFGSSKGFQKGDPEKAAAVTLQVFDPSDREFSIFIGRTKGTDGRVRQEDINSVLASIRYMNDFRPSDGESESSSRIQVPAQAEAARVSERTR